MSRFCLGQVSLYITVKWQSFFYCTHIESNYFLRAWPHDSEALDTSLQSASQLCKPSLSTLKIILQIWNTSKILLRGFRTPLQKRCIHVNGKVIPWQAQCGPGGLGSQIFMTFGTWRWWGCHPHAPAAFTLRKCFRYSFSLRAESTPGPWYSRKEICHWRIQRHHWECIHVLKCFFDERRKISFFS